MDFGFTNDEQQMAEVLGWRDAAIADGWSCKPSYENEPIERASTLVKDGFTAQVLSRILKTESPAKFKWQATISVWGPDNLAIPCGRVYDFASLLAGTRTCSKCGATDVETIRFGFAGRACRGCQPAAEQSLGPMYYS